MITLHRWLGLAVLVGCSTPQKEGTDPAKTAADDDAGEGESKAIPEGGGGRDVAAVDDGKAEVAVAEPAVKAWEPREEDKVTPEFELEFPENLTYFYDRLAEVDDGEKKVVTVVNLGASMIGLDGLPGVMRKHFQKRFGDGGAGLVLMQRYMPNYMHRSVKLTADGWDHCYIAFLCKKDGHYGLGGTTFWASTGASTTISTRKGELGDEVSRFELWYAADKGGGKVEMRVDSEDPVVISTSAEALEDRWHEIDVEQGPHKIRVRALGPGRVRTYGVLLENDGPGVVWDQFSMLGAFTKRMLGWNQEHIAAQIEHRDPELIVFTYGGNDSRRVALGTLTREEYAAEYTEAIRRVKAGKPEASCLIQGVHDRGKSLDYEIQGKDMQVLVEGQRDAAKASGCAFYDSYTAMGGAGSLEKWRKKSPPLAEPDMKHLNAAGREVLATWTYEAIIAGYVKHRQAKAAAK
jgi:lysophospholipase L1-like esterase